MGFDQKKFMKRKYSDRTGEVNLPALSEYFDEGEKPVFVVRALEGEELARAQEAAARNNRIEGVIEGLVSDKRAQITDSIKELLGVVGVPGNTAKALEMVVAGSVEPEIDLEFALKLCKNHPVEFLMLNQEITRLTGQGRLPGKLKSSGETPASGRQSDSAT